VELSMLPKELGMRERFQLARDVGFEGIEIQTVSDPKDADEMKDASQKAGLVIHSVMNAEHWRSPLSSADPAVVAKSVAGMETSLRNAKLWGAETVLLVPAVVNPETGYQDAWTRSQKVIRERILPLASELKVIVGIEEVWNKFLLSPLELNKYVDEFASPVGPRVRRRRQHGLLRLPAGLDPHRRQAHGAPAPQGLQARPVRTGRSSGRTWARATSTGPRSGRRSRKSATRAGRPSSSRAATPRT
jgi:hypothetical protein